MGFAIQQSNSTVPAEITLAEGTEEVLHPEQAVEGEMPEQTAGYLQSSEGKSYTFIPQDPNPQSQKMDEAFSRSQPLKEQKSLASKEEIRSFKETNPLKGRSFEAQKGEKPPLTDKQAALTQSKSDQAAKETLQSPRQHPPASKPRPHDLMSGKTPSAARPREGAKQEKNETRPQQKTPTRESATKHSLESQSTRPQEKTEKQEQEQQIREEKEEGFAEDERKQKQDEDSEGDEHGKVSSIKKRGMEELLTYSAEESTLLTELFNMRVNHFDVLVLFIEVMKLALKGREQERISRMQERELQLQHIQNMVDNFKQSGKMMLFSSLGSGVLAVVSGACPIVGHMKGGWILDKLSSVFSSLDGMKQDKFFEGVTKMTFAMSEMSKSTGQIQDTFAQSSRTHDQHMADIRRTDWEEDTRTMEEIKDQWKSMENFIHQSLQMYHEAVRQLYN